VSSLRFFTLVLGILIGAVAVAADNSAYQKGTLTIYNVASRKSYNLKAGLKIYQISNCGDFQNGQEVDFVMKDGKIYIARPGAKDYKCSIEATTESADPNTPPTPNDAPAFVYMKGTILGFSIRRDLHVSGGAGNPVASAARKAKTYELQGPDLIYQMDYCGSFQAGQFTPGQVVEFRVDRAAGRLYVRHDGDKEYGCQLEGTRKLDSQPGTTSQPAAVSTAKLSITSVPDGADIEIDGDFVGNTPSDLEVASGDRSIVVKKSGFKNWERKLKVVAGSNIHLNAELEKSANP
jgi:hypothetical protein